MKRKTLPRECEGIEDREDRIERLYVGKQRNGIGNGERGGYSLPEICSRNMFTLKARLEKKGRANRKLLNDSFSPHFFSPCYHVYKLHPCIRVLEIAIDSSRG